jgi:hypothetical protein
MCDTYTWRKAKHIHETPILSSVRMLHKDYDRKGSVKKSLGVSLKGLDIKTNW